MTDGNSAKDDNPRPLFSVKRMSAPKKPLTACKDTMIAHQNPKNPSSHSFSQDSSTLSRKRPSKLAQQDS